MTELRKPPHAFARLLWLFGLVYVVVVPLANIYFIQRMTMTEQQQAIDNFGLWSSARMGVMGAIQLWVAGAVIELLDSIRWALIPTEDRPATRRRYIIVRWRALRGMDPDR